MPKLSKRDRFVLKWNGPECVTQRKRNRRVSRATMGHGCETTRHVGTIYEYRFRGKQFKDMQECFKAAGVSLDGKPTGILRGADVSWRRVKLSIMKRGLFRMPNPGSCKVTIGLDPAKPGTDMSVDYSIDAMGYAAKGIGGLLYAVGTKIADVKAWEIT